MESVALEAVNSLLISKEQEYYYKLRLKLRMDCLPNVLSVNSL